MNKSVSIYLDTSRFLAATAILVLHFLALNIVDTDVRFPYGQQAVMVFFVISGFVIAFVADTREKTWRAYSVSRCARLYSVVLPALVLAMVLDPIGLAIDADAYPAVGRDQPLLRVGASLLFINQIWNFTIQPLSIGPFWSLSYEFFYYLFFGAVVYAPGRWRYIAAFAVLLVAGPRITMYLPIWLLGVFIYHLSSHMKSQAWVARGLFAISMIAFVMFSIHGSPIDHWQDLMRAALDADGYYEFLGVRIYIDASVMLPGDFAVAFAFGGTLLFCDQVAGILLRSRAVTRAIRFCAAHTFSIYLYHVPLLIFFDVLVDNVIVVDARSDGLLNGLLVSVFTVSSILVLARYTENRKGIYVDVFQRVYERFLIRTRGSQSTP